MTYEQRGSAPSGDIPIVRHCGDCVVYLEGMIFSVRVRDERKAKGFTVLPRIDFLERRTANATGNTPRLWDAVHLVNGTPLNDGAAA